MEIDPGTLSSRDAYRWMTACWIPRPIAWVSTLDAEGRANLAPFSYNGGVSSDPPILMLSVGRRKGVPKDTGANLLATGEAVLHVPTRPLAEKMVATSAEVAPGVDEFDLAGLAKLAAKKVKPWRVAECPIAYEAKVIHHLTAGKGPVDVFLLEVVWMHVADSVLVDGLPDPALLAAVGRLGGIGYCDTSRPFEIPRP